MAKGEGAESGSAAGLLPTGILQAGERPSQVKKELKKKQQLSICNKLCYAVGGAPYQVTGCALGFFLQIYLLDVAQVSGPSLPGPAQHPEVGKTRYSQAGSLRFPLL